MKRFSNLLRVALAAFFCVGLAPKTLAQCGNASVIGAGTHSGTVTDYQWSTYTVILPAGQTMTMDETFDSRDVVWELFNANCMSRQLGHLPGLNSISWGNTTGAAVSLFLAARNYDPIPNTTESFTFVIDLIPNPQCPADAFELNDDCTNATAIIEGTYTGLTVPAGDRDHYKIDVPSGMRVVMQETLDPLNVVDWGISGGGCFVANYGNESSTLSWLNSSGAPSSAYLNVRFNYTGGALCSDYAFDVFLVPDPCLFGINDWMEDNHDCATAFPISDGAYRGLYVHDGVDDHYGFTILDGATVSIDLKYMAQNGYVTGYLRAADSPYCGSALSSPLDLLAYTTLPNGHEFMTWTNSTGADLDVVLEVIVATFASTTCNTYELNLSGSANPGGGVMGPAFCALMNPNSTGASTLLVGGWKAGAVSSLHLEATHGPPSQMAYFLVGTGSADPGIVLSQGRLCLAVSGNNSIGRYNRPSGPMNSIGQFDGSGVLQNLVGTSTSGSGFDVPLTLPMAGAPNILAGSTWHFQLWHRDTAGTSNFSSGLSATF